MSRRKKRIKKSSTTYTEAAASQASSSAWDRYWYGTVDAVRPYLLMKGVLLLLAFDTWLLRIPGGWKYGLDGFNVAHFHWLDSLQPPPTVGAHVGILLAVGMLALVCALIDPGFWTRLLLALLYTYSWAKSMFDNYQHHYFLSLVLIAFIFFPRITARDLYPDGAEPNGPAQKGQRTGAAPQSGVRSWAYVLLGVNVAIVYFFTAVNKLEPAWRAGEIIERLARPKQLLLPIQRWLEGIGVAQYSFWQTIAIGTTALEFFIAAGYLVAARQDERPDRWRRFVCWSALIAVSAFNGIGNELIMDLRIGWFSYYMILVAGVFFLPDALLRRIGWALTWPSRTATSPAANFLPQAGGASIFTQALIVAGGLAIVAFVVMVGAALELPGAETVAALTAGALLWLLVFAVARRRYAVAVRCIVAAGLANLLLWATLANSTARFYFYSGMAHYQRQAKNVEAADAADRKARHYLPPGREDLLKRTGLPDPESN
jgi:hypothetical protein